MSKLKKLGSPSNVGELLKYILDYGEDTHIFLNGCTANLYYDEQLKALIFDDSDSLEEDNKDNDFDINTQTTFTVKQFIQKKGWIFECDTSVPYRSMDVIISFIHQDGTEDETEFTIDCFKTDELSLLFKDFCAENGFKYNSISNICVVKTYPVKASCVSDYL